MPSLRRAGTCTSGQLPKPLSCEVQSPKVKTHDFDNGAKP